MKNPAKLIALKAEEKANGRDYGPMSVMAFWVHDPLRADFPALKLGKYLYQHNNVS